MEGDVPVENMDRQMNFAARCQAAGVPLGFALYFDRVNAQLVQERQWTPDITRFIEQEIATAGQWTVDFIGMCEALDH